MKISIITATYNSASTLRDTMLSVLRQGYGDWEHIVVDGRSTDGTTDILRQMEPRYGERLRWVSEPDKGLYDAMNKGLAMASGDVVGILNSDDFYTTDDVLETIARTMDDSRVDAVYGDVHFVDEKDLSRCVRYYSSAGFRRWKMRFGLMPAHPTFYCRRELYERYGGFDTSYRVAADFEQLLRLIFIHRITARYVPRDFVTMRTGGASTSGWRSHLRIMQDHLHAFRCHGIHTNMFLLSMRYPYKIWEQLCASF